ncbi:MAG: hypothetical protein QOJ04_5090 [Caballeronia sp.]|jgi:hypothetical protein|nr:hypothetical protein [Caballeronia sp.]
MNRGLETHELRETSYWFPLAERLFETGVSLKHLNSGCSSIRETLHQRARRLQLTFNTAPSRQCPHLSFLAAYH